MKGIAHARRRVEVVVRSVESAVPPVDRRR
jgi:hypothetical protein